MMYSAFRPTSLGFEKKQVYEVKTNSDEISANAEETRVRRVDWELINSLSDIKKLD